VTSSIAGVEIPDTRLVADATELVSADAPPCPRALPARLPADGLRRGHRVERLARITAAATRVRTSSPCCRSALVEMTAQRARDVVGRGELLLR
jgi:hypothetical protein